MDYPNVFVKEESDKLIERINALTPETKPDWGKMNVSQMLAHVSVPYEVVFKTDQHGPKGLLKWVLKTFIKPTVVGKKPYKKNSPTAKNFIISDLREFQKEKDKLINNINNLRELGEAKVIEIDNVSFGYMTINEWNNLFYKHLDHHLKQFKV